MRKSEKAIKNQLLNGIKKIFINFINKKKLIKRHPDKNNKDE